MAQLTRPHQHVLEVEYEVKWAPNQFYNFLKNNFSMLPKIFPCINKREVVEGDGKSVGSVTRWACLLGLNVLVGMEKITKIDDANMSFTNELMQGSDALKTLKSLAFKTSVIPKATGGSVLKWSIMYEKLNEADASDPHLYIDFCMGMSAAFDSHFRNTN
ncbi:hypothetical protein Syun_016588 [Stephania yunnanensis]|uniref:Bet v I/Major latex protein domain-containing protein n=1 Tax=Stephania yunnanensis TaxID=152371 RepID=A0AAP0J566_9MAGN